MASCVSKYGRSKRRYRYEFSAVEEVERLQREQPEQVFQVYRRYVCKHWHVGRINWHKQTPDEVLVGKLIAALKSTINN